MMAKKPQIKNNEILNYIEKGLGFGLIPFFVAALYSLVLNTVICTSIFTMKYFTKKPALLLLEDGTAWQGSSIGFHGTSGGEICFNTGMTGYQEIFTDPSYHGQIMVTTNTHIGNYGILEEESQSNQISIAGLIVKEFSFSYSRPAGETSLFDFLCSIPG